MKVDINCDVGEGMQNEHLIMPYISSCNIACGGHFGNAATIDATLLLAKKNDVKIGAHPSYPDKENFGRKQLAISNKTLQKSIETQMALFLERLELQNLTLHHIKPHGALYNAIARDKKLAYEFLEMILPYLKNAFLYVPFQSEIAALALSKNIPFKYEVFGDRNYNIDYSLVSRSHKNALIVDEKKVFTHVLKMVVDAQVETLSGKIIPIKADTICIHGDTKNALELVQFLKKSFAKKNIVIV